VNEKGQVLEYLMTYGWAFIVIAIVCGVVGLIVTIPDNPDPAEYYKNELCLVQLHCDDVICEPTGLLRKTECVCVIDSGEKMLKYTDDTNYKLIHFPSQTTIPVLNNRETKVCATKSIVHQLGFMRWE